MKRTIKIIIYFLVFIALFATSVNAQDACTITLSANKTTLKPGEEVVITLYMSNVTKENGIVQFLSVLDFSEEVFEIVFDKDEELSAAFEGTEFEGLQILYSGKQDTDATIKNPWYLLYMESGGSKGIFGSTGADPQLEDQAVGKIKLKVKEDVELTSTTVFISATEVFDLESILNAESTGELFGDEIADAEIQLQIDGVVEEQKPNPPKDDEIQNTTNPNNNTTGDNEENNTQTKNESIDNNNTTNRNNTQTNNTQVSDTTNKNNTQNNINKTNNKVQQENKAKENVPYTGIEDWVPFIFIGIITSVMAYINYRRYKDI